MQRCVGASSFVAEIGDRYGEPTAPGLIAQWAKAMLSTASVQGYL
jgi:hypothetical protein